MRIGCVTQLDSSDLQHSCLMLLMVYIFLFKVCCFQGKKPLFGLVSNSNFGVYNIDCTFCPVAQRVPPVHFVSCFLLSCSVRWRQYLSGHSAESLESNVWRISYSDFNTGSSLVVFLGCIHSPDHASKWATVVNHDQYLKSGLRFRPSVPPINQQWSKR